MDTRNPAILKRASCSFAGKSQGFTIVSSSFSSPVSFLFSSHDASLLSASGSAAAAAVVAVRLL
ncbi:exported hypothetical protein [uncultured delta proteobacterium]|uniref:Uncharacterized protein n=1 Tax=uncultured delta proteobacterium TaxID=34034 RepID=A0A212J890_9DELT|nr:exported hypothetical protein [uncultured delta proteobacterium]